MKSLLTFFFLSIMFAISCQTNAENFDVKTNTNINETSEVQLKNSIVETPKSNQQSIHSKIGNVELGKNCVRFITWNPNLEDGDKVQIVLINKTPQKILKAEIVEDTDCEQTPFGDLTVFNPNLENTELITYLLKLNDNQETENGLGIGIVNLKKDIQIVEGLATVDLDEDRTSEYFRGCTSYEGLHLTVWKGKPLIGKNIWRSYYNFNFATDPTCEKKDFEDQPDIIQSSVGIVDGQKDKICLRTKNGNLKENTPVSIVTSLDESPQKVLNAKVEKKLEKSCARYASESTDKNPGENFYYKLSLLEEVDEYQEVFGIGVIKPKTPFQSQNNLVSIDLNGDGKTEFFRRCAGFEGTLFTIWTGEPLKGKQIWHSFYYVDYATEPNCKKEDNQDIND